MGRIVAGFKMVRDGGTVLRSEPRLMLLPLCGLGAILLLATVEYGCLRAIAASGSALLLVLGWMLLLIALYVCGAFTAVFVSAAIVAGATARLEGRQSGMRESVVTAWSHRAALFRWSLLSASVGLILRSETGSRNAALAFAGGGLGLAWTAATFLVVPVILSENAATTTALQRAKVLFYNRWGEEAAGYIGLNFILGLALALIAVVALLVAFTTALAAGLVIGVFGAISLLVLGTVIRSAFSAVLYRSALEPR